MHLQWILNTWEILKTHINMENIYQNPFIYIFFHIHNTLVLPKLGFIHSTTNGVYMTNRSGQNWVLCNITKSSCNITKSFFILQYQSVILHNPFFILQRFFFPYWKFTILIFETNVWYYYIPFVIFRISELVISHSAFHLVTYLKEFLI